jgi:hypothetical protein
VENVHSKAVRFLNEHTHQMVRICELFQRNVLEDAEFVKKTFRSDEASFEVKYAENLCSCLYGCLGNWQICEDIAMNLSGLTA